MAKVGVVQVAVSWVGDLGPLVAAAVVSLVRNAKSLVYAGSDLVLCLHTLMWSVVCRT